MKQIRFVIILFLLPFFTEAQSNCKTIILKDGHKYNGVIVAANSDAIKFENCDIENRPLVAVFTSDVAAILRPGTGDTISYSQLKKEMRIQRFQTNEKARSDKQETKLYQQKIKLKQTLDTVKCVHFGIIPFQFLTRSSGLYLRYDLKKFSLEYRPTYTYTVLVNPMDAFSHYYDNPFFQGVNNSFIFYFPTQKRTQIGLMLTYKHWWHDIEPIENDKFYDSYKSNDPHLVEMRSTVMDGFGAGLEFAYYFKVHKDYDFNFFWNASFTYFNSFSHVYSIYTPYTNYYSTGLPTYPYTETKGRFYLNATCGFKFGFKKPLKK